MTLGLVGCGADPVAEQAVRPVVAARLAAAQELSLTAEALPSRRETVALAVSGRLIALPPAVGSQVSQGDLLAAVDPAPFEQALRDERARFQQVEADIKRRRGLTHESLAPTADQAALDARLLAARERLLAAEQDLSASRCQAPFTGRVAERLLREIGRVPAGTPVVVLEDERVHDMDVAVDGAGPGAILLALTDEALRSRLRFAVASQGRSRPLDLAGIERDGVGLRMRLHSVVPLALAPQAQVALTLLPPARPLVPVSAVQMIEGRQQVMVAEPVDEPGVAGWRAVPRAVRIAGIDDGWAAVLDGIAVGELVLAPAPATIDEQTIFTIEERDHGHP